MKRGSLKTLDFNNNKQLNRKTTSANEMKQKSLKTLDINNNGQH